MAQTSKSNAQKTTGKTKSIRVLVVSAPSGSRCRAGFRFGKEPRELTEEMLGGEQAEKTVDILRADPKLKIDVKEIEVPDEDETASE